MSKFVKKIVSLAMAMCCVANCFWGTIVYAGEDVEASAYGFVVDNGVYKTSYWYNTVTSNVKRDGNIIGTNSINIGATRAKSTVSGGYYLDQIMVKCAMKGKNPKTNYCGYAEHLQVKSQLPSGSYLVAYSPESEAGMKTYEVGLSADTDKTVGISASTSVTKKALEINNYCDESAKKINICYDYIHHTFRWNWDTYGKYAYNESIQRAHYTIKTKNSGYKVTLVVTSKFERWDDTPGYWANAYGLYGELEHTINFYMPY